MSDESEIRRSYELARAKHALDADIRFRSEAYLEALGDQLAGKDNIGLRGLEAVRFHLMERHHWLPKDVMAMTIEELEFAMTRDLKAFKVPTAVKAAVGEVLGLPSDPEEAAKGKRKPRVRRLE